jgi:hypothetical protein
LRSTRASAPSRVTLKSNSLMECCLGKNRE